VSAPHLWPGASGLLSCLCLGDPTQGAGSQLTGAFASPAQRPARVQGHCPSKPHPCPSSASALGYPELSCPPAPRQWVLDSPARWEGVVGARGERRGGLPAPLQPQLWDSSGLCQTPIKSYKFS